MSDKKIIVNGRFLRRQVTGVERYAAEILRCLDDRVSIACPQSNLQGLKGHAWEQCVLPGRIKREDLLWSPANTGPLAVSNQVLTVHDLSALDHPEWFKSTFAAWYQVFLPILIKRVRRVITPSQYVREKIISRFHLREDQVVAIHPAVNISQFFPQTPFERYQRYILFVGSLEPRKNLATLLGAWKAIAKRYPDVSLVLAGSHGSVFRQVTLPTDLDRVRWLGYVPDSVLPALYSGASLFVLPSFDEGFGLPVLEAMACGVPVIAAKSGALPEVAGTAALFFRPDEPDELTRLLDQCLSDSELRKTLSEQGMMRVRQFSWQSTAEQVWDTLRGANET